LEKRKDELVWMQKRKGTEQHVSKRLEKRSKGGKSGAAQRGKSVAERCTVRRTEKHSKREGGSRKEVRRTFKMLREV